MMIFINNSKINNITTVITRSKLRISDNNNKFLRNE